MNTRSALLATLGSVLYIAISPDMFGAMSNTEYTLLLAEGPTLVWTYIEGEAILPADLRLPGWFYDHFTKEVLPNIGEVRLRTKAREYMRKELETVLGDPKKLEALYTPTGDTYSDMLVKALAGELA